MSLVLHSEEYFFSDIPESDNGTVSQKINHNFSTDIIFVDVALKGFQLTHKERDNNFHSCAVQITNVTHEQNNVQCTVSLQLSDNSDHTLDPNQVSVTLLFIANCE